MNNYSDINSKIYFETVRAMTMHEGSNILPDHVPIEFQKLQVVQLRLDGPC